MKFLLPFIVTLKGFNSIWETNRSFPIDMAGFAVNISLILARPDVSFSYNVKRGYQVSIFFEIKLYFYV